MFIFFLLNGFIDVYSSKAFDTPGILSAPASDVHWTTENKRHSN